MEIRTLTEAREGRVEVKITTPSDRTTVTVSVPAAELNWVSEDGTPLLEHQAHLQEQIENLDKALTLTTNSRNRNREQVVRLRDRVQQLRQEVQLLRERGVADRKHDHELVVAARAGREAERDRADRTEQLVLELTNELGNRLTADQVAAAIDVARAEARAASDQIKRLKAELSRRFTTAQMEDAKAAARAERCAELELVIAEIRAVTTKNQLFREMSREDLIETVRHVRQALNSKPAA